MARKTEKAEKSDNLQLLKAAIKEKNPQRLYFFYGEETYLMQYYLTQLQRLLVDEVTESFNFHRLNSESFDTRAFADAVENLPMMAEATMVWVDDINIFSLPEVDRERLIEVFSDIPDYCTVVFTYVTEVWHPDKRFTKLYDAVTRYGTAVEFPKQQLRDLIPWVGRRFAACKKRISSDLCSYLIEITGGTMTALSSEIAKICAYSGAEEITKSDIDAVTEPVLDAMVFHISELLSQRKNGEALKKLQTILKMQQKPIAVLGAIGGHFRRLATAKVLLDNGKGPDELARLCKMGDYPARKTMDTASRFSAEFFRKAAELVVETDYHMKTSFDEPERLLETLVLQLAQEARNG